MAFRNADKIPAAVRAAMETPGAMLEYRASGGRGLLAIVVRHEHVDSAGIAQTLGLWATVYAGHPRKAEKTYYSKLGLATGHVERELLRGGVRAWNRETWTPSARLHGSGAVLG